MRRHRILFTVLALVLLRLIQRLGLLLRLVVHTGWLLYAARLTSRSTPIMLLTILLPTATTAPRLQRLSNRSAYVPSHSTDVSSPADCSRSGWTRTGRLLALGHSPLVSGTNSSGELSRLSTIRSPWCPVTVRPMRRLSRSKAVPWARRARGATTTTLFTPRADGRSTASLRPVWTVVRECSRDRDQSAGLDDATRRKS